MKVDENLVRDIAIQIYCSGTHDKFYFQDNMKLYAELAIKFINSCKETVDEYNNSFKKLRIDINLNYTRNEYESIGSETKIKKQYEKISYSIGGEQFEHLFSVGSIELGFSNVRSLLSDKIDDKTILRIYHNGTFICEK